VRRVMDRKSLGETEACGDGLPFVEILSPSIF